MLPAEPYFWSTRIEGHFRTSINDAVKRDPRSTKDLKFKLGFKNKGQMPGRLGDHRAMDQFLAVLTDPTASVTRLVAIAPALPQIGDRRCIDPLLEIMADYQQMPLARAFAAVALGGIGDKWPRPWSAAIGQASTTARPSRR